MMTGKGMMMVLLACAVTLSEQYLLGKQGYKRSSSAVPTCTDEFKNISGHTMCMPDNPGVEKKGVSAADIATILQIHNANRSATNPPATNLVGLVWNDKIAAVAQKYAQTCPTGHDKERGVPSLGLTVGQNLAFNYDSWTKAMMGWSSEVADFTYGGTNELKKVGHYTQMVQSNAFLIGCGFATCRGTKYSKHYVCNYASAQMGYNTPYINGTRGSACPSNRKNGLCNCNGLVCLNQGTLDLNKCTCKCQQMYKGDNCGELDCSLFEPGFCTNVETSSCNKAYFYTRCPVKCGLCPPKKPFVSAHGCKYIGPRYSAEECKAFGDGGRDNLACASQKGSFGCEYCRANVPKDYCPVMCGLCDKQ